MPALIVAPAAQCGCRIDAGSKRKLAGASLVAIGLSHDWRPLVSQQ
jgi:hypothetical protein